MSHWGRWCGVAVLIASAAVFPGAAQNRGMWQGRPATTDIVSHVVFEGNRRVSSEILQGRIFIRPGDLYPGTDALGHDVIALRNTKHFSSVHLEVKDDPNRANAKIVIFHLIERLSESKTNSQ
jgi:outer membrane protein assembly factor BamA